MAIYDDPGEVIDPQRWRAEVLDTVDAFMHQHMRRHFEAPNNHAWEQPRNDWHKAFDAWLTQQGPKQRQPPHGVPCGDVLCPAAECQAWRDAGHCGAQDDALVRDPTVPDNEVNEATGRGFRHPTCTLLPGHDGYHEEWSDDLRLLAEWSGR